jgi:NADH dehydrogenase
MDVVTGSFGYIGKYIANELLNKGREVKTITTHPNKPNPFGAKVQATTYNFDNPDKLIATLSGCDTLFNTYWVRFNYRNWSFDKALNNTKTLFECAKKAGMHIPADADHHFRLIATTDSDRCRPLIPVDRDHPKQTKPSEYNP